MWRYDHTKDVPEIRLDWDHHFKLQSLAGKTDHSRERLGVSILGLPESEEASRSHKFVLWPPHVYNGTCTPTHIIQINWFTNCLIGKPMFVFTPWVEVSRMEGLGKSILSWVLVDYIVLLYTQKHKKAQCTSSLCSGDTLLQSVPM